MRKCLFLDKLLYFIDYKGGELCLFGLSTGCKDKNLPDLSYCNRGGLELVKGDYVFEKVEKSFL
jgi:hypothetical protein